MTRVRSVPPFVGEGMVSRHVLIDAADVVFMKGVIEAHEGLACVFAEEGGDLTIATDASLAADLDALLAGLAAELRARRESR